jgi:DNA polymerase-3 subunit gamma/tau
MLLVRLARRPPLLPIDDLVSRLAALERRLGGAGGGARGPAAGGAPAARPGTPRAREAAPAPSASPRAEADSRDEPPPAPPPALALVTQPAPPAKAAPSEPAGAAPSETPAADATGNDELLEQLRPIVERVREQRPELAAFLDQAAALVVRPGELALAWEPGAVLARQCSDKASLELVTRAATSHFGTTTGVSFELDSPRARGRRTLSAIDAERRARLDREAVAKIKGHPRVAEAIEILGARLKDVKLQGR